MHIHAHYLLGHQLSTTVLDLVNLEVASLAEAPHLCHDTVHLVLVGLNVTLYQLEGGGRRKEEEEEGKEERTKGVCAHHKAHPTHHR